MKETTIKQVTEYYGNGYSRVVYKETPTLFLVSYQIGLSPCSMCGNKSFDNIESAKDFIDKNKHKWNSYSSFTYIESGNLTNDLTEIKLV